jgi:exonuclease SbcC
MLIRSLALINFKKYSNLLIDILPQQGVVKVGGKNESGKTSIGEAVCFALFGRTFLNDKANAKRLVRWGEQQMSVVLVLENADSEAFEITRTVNDDALSSLCVVRLSDEHILTDSLKDSDNVISDLLGYGYDTFIDSFCMVQRELVAPDANSNSIKQMAGLGDYAAITDSLSAENDEERVTLSVLQPRYDKKTTALEAIELDESWLPELVDGKESLLANSEDKRQLVDQLDELSVMYTESYQQFNAINKWYSLFEWLGVFLVTLMLGAWMVWGAFQFFPDIIYNWLPASTSSHHANAFITWVQVWMFPFAMGGVLFYSISLFFTWRTELKITSLNEQAEEFSNVLMQGHQEVISEPNSVVPARIANKLQGKYKYLQEKQALPSALPSLDKFNHLPDLIYSLADFRTSPIEVEQSIKDLQETLHRQGQEIDLCLLGLDNDIAIEKERSDRAGQLRAGLQKISQSMHQHENNVAICDYSIAMMQRAAARSIDGFNQAITKFAEHVLPYFTDNRYSQLKINDDLSVDVFSDEKQSYMKYDEISSGTQRQIMLALRMGMSEQLAKNTGNKKQFIFLDEPFAFFDHQRTVATLAALPNVSEVITQVWITSQEFPEDLTLINEV